MRCTCCSRVSTRATTPTTDRLPRSRASTSARREAPRGVCAEPRPGGQPRVRRSPARRVSCASQPSAAPRPGRPAPVHGRGVRRATTVPLLHRPHRSRDRPGDPGRTSTRVRRLRGVRGRRRARSAGASTRSRSRSSSRRRRREHREYYRRLLELRRTLPPDRCGRSSTKPRASYVSAAATSSCWSNFSDVEQHGVGPWEGRVAMSELWPGHPFPLGATWDGDGTNFPSSRSTPSASSCASSTTTATRRASTMPERTAFHWHCYLPGIGPGQRYGYRVHGPFEPEAGTASTRGSCSIDPYAKAIDGPVGYGAPTCCPYVPDGDDADLVPTTRTIRTPSRSRSSSTERFDWDGDRPPASPWNETIIYETHVKGFTKRHPRLREDLRGTYAGLASEEAVEHFVALGVTAIELLPVHHIADEAHLVDKGLSELLGLQLDRLLRARTAIRRDRRRGEQIARVQGNGEGAPRGRDRGHPRRRLQPHRRRQSPGADALLPRHRQRVVLPAVARGPALLRRLHRAPATASTRCTRTCCGSSWTRCGTS